MFKFIKGLFVNEPEQPAPANLVLLTPNDGSWDPKVVRRLFDAGLSRLHVQVRKDWERRHYEQFILSLPPAYWPRLVLAEEPELVEERALGGFQMHPGERIPRRWPQHATVSAKCHDYDELRCTDKGCGYVFLAPLFESVSKKDHRPRRTLREFEVILGRWKAEGGAPVMALGGITPHTAPKAREMGFDGIAFIGSVWKQPDPVRAFLDLERAWYGKEARKLKRTY
jgi:thiamine-phosphate pyrophosphorylase